MRLLKLSLAGAVLVGLVGVGVAFAQPYYMGAILEDELPDWVMESPSIELEPGAELDESIENLGGLPPVGNQAQQGSCTAWATAYYYLTYLQWQEHGFDPSDPNNICSPAFTYNLINGGMDGGSQPSDAFKIFETIGCATHADMPYTDANCTRFPEEQAFINGMPNRTAVTHYINTHTQSGIQSLKNHLLNGNIAMTAISVWSNFQNISNFNHTYSVADIYGSDPGGHAVTVIGFDDNFETADGTGAFRMVNSWGIGWGEDGYWWMSYEAFLSDQIGWGYTLYASDRIDYEPQLYAAAEIDHSDRYALKYRVGLGDPGNPDVVSTYFDLNMGSRRDWNFPYGGRIILDATDVYASLDPNNPNQLYLEIQDRDGYDGRAGTVNALSMEDMALDFRAISGDVPVTLPDNGSWTETPLTLYYAVVPPQDFAAELDLTNGHVTLSWADLNELNEFNEFVVFRDGEEIGRTAGAEYVDELPAFGIYSYEVVSEWDEATSWPTETRQVNYIEPVAPRFATITYVDGETGEYTLNWDQLRDFALVYDDGIADASLRPSNEAESGMMVAQRMTAPDDGKVVKIGAYYNEPGNRPNGRIRLYMMRDNNGLPGDIMYWGSYHIPSADAGWRWYDTRQVRVDVAANEEFWVAVSWIDVGRTGLGRDLSSNHYRQAMSPDGENWITSGAGNPMLRVMFGAEERVNDWTGLLGYDVYLDGELVGELDSDTREFAGTFPEPGDYSFQVVANYLQGDWEGEPMAYYWDGTEQAVDETGLPGEWAVSQAYPNPFNPTATLDVTVAEQAHVTVVVYDVLGRRVATALDRSLTAGEHRVTLDGRRWAAGAYFVSVQAGNHLSEIRKITLLK